MVDIDSIMEMLDWNNPRETQEKGIMLAKEVKCYNVFIQPWHNGYAKNVWENCATIISGKTDVEIKPYLLELFRWLMDMTWPGSYCIYERLRKYDKENTFFFSLRYALCEAKACGEKSWVYILEDFLHDKDL